MHVADADQKKLLNLLARTISSLEELLLAGLTTASQATHQTLAVTFQEASRLKLLRLGATLRATCDEIQRYTKDDPLYSTPRLMFFVNRSWLICKGLQRAIEQKDERALANLLWNAPNTPAEALQVVCLGVVKKIAANAFCAFEFRLRNIANGQPLVWSTVFPMKPDVAIPAEGFLHLPQRQKFNPSLFLDRKVITIDRLMLSQPQHGPARIQLLEDSQVKATDDYSDWTQWLTWDMQGSAARLSQHQVTPFDVDAELQEEFAVTTYHIEPSHDESDERTLYPLHAHGLQCDLSVARTLEGEATQAAVQGLLKKKNRPPLFGLMHYANSRPIVQPLSLFEDGQLRYITISDKAIDRKSLLAALKFT